jgi:hypothetical protein
MAINLELSQLPQRTLPLPSGSQADRIEILDATNPSMNAVTGTNSGMTVGDFLTGFVATANSNLGITETASNTQPGILLTVPTTGLVITQHSGVIATPSPSGSVAASVAAESSGYQQSFTTTISLGTALSVTGDDLIYASLGTSVPATVTLATGFNIRTNSIGTGNANGIATIDALGVTSASTPSLTVSATQTYGMTLNGVAFKAATGTTWNHNWTASVQATSSSQASLVYTTGSGKAITTGDLIIVTVASSAASALTVSVSDGTHTYSVAVSDPGTYTGCNSTTFYFVATSTVASGYVITATLSGESVYYAAMAVDDYTPAGPASLSINWATSDSFITSTLSGITTISFSGATVGQKIDLILGSNGQTVTWPSGITGVGTTWPPTLAGSGLRDEFVIKCIASNTYLAYGINGGVGF